MYSVSQPAEGIVETDHLTAVAEALRAENYEIALQGLFNWPLIFQEKDWDSRIKKSIIAQLDERIWLRLVAAAKMDLLREAFNQDSFSAKLWYYLLLVGGIKPKTAKEFFKQFSAHNFSSVWRFENSIKTQLPKNLDEVGSDWRLSSKVYDSGGDGDGDGGDGDGLVREWVQGATMPSRFDPMPYSAPTHLPLAPLKSPPDEDVWPVVPSFLP